MPLTLKVGAHFPDHRLRDDAGDPTSVAQVADGRPLLLAFYRGSW